MENSKIEWCDHTFSPWHGCAKVSAGCKNCYADTQHSFHYSSLKSQQGTCWGINAPRLAVSADTWKKPLRWNRDAAAAGVRARVFCASMADVFEAQGALSAAFAGETAQVPSGQGKTRTVRFINIAAERLRLLRLIHDTPHLYWLLLTKRPENIMPALRTAYETSLPGNSESSSLLNFSHWLGQWAEGKQAPANVWLGTSVENQEQADARIPHLLAAPAAVRFLSCEPLLGPVNLTRVDGDLGRTPMCMVNALTGRQTDMGRPCRDVARIDWVIVGGESGPKARPMHPDWARSLRDQCQAVGMAFLFKQWGEWVPAKNYTGDLYPRLHNRDSVCIDGSTDGSHAMSTDPAKRRVDIYRPGKHAAGRLLDGQEHTQFPAAQ